MPFFTDPVQIPEVRLSARKSLPGKGNVKSIVIEFGKPRPTVDVRKTRAYQQLFPNGPLQSAPITPDPDLMDEYQNLKTEIEQSQDDDMMQAMYFEQLHALLLSNHSLLLRQAVSKGCTELVRELIETAKPVTLKKMLRAGNFKAFDVAVREGYVEPVKLLLEAADKAGVLHAMISHRKGRVFKTINASINIQENPGFKAIVNEILFQVGKRDDFSSIKLYFELSSSISKTRYQMIFSAAMTKIEDYRNQILTLQSVREAYQALTTAVKKGNVERVNQLFADQLSADKTGAASQYLLNFNHSALLRAAVEKGNHNMVKTLWKHASDKTKEGMLKVRGCEPLGRAVGKGYVDIAVTLLDAARKMGLLNAVVEYQDYAVFRTAMMKGASNSKARQITLGFLFQAGKNSDAFYEELRTTVNLKKDELPSMDRRREYYRGLIRESGKMIREYKKKKMIRAANRAVRIPERASWNGFLNTRETKQNHEPTVRHSAHI